MSEPKPVYTVTTCAECGGPLGNAPQPDPFGQGQICADCARAFSGPPAMALGKPMGAMACIIYAVLRKL
jgi:hypothetical protein